MAVPLSPASSFHLTPAQLAAFDKDGFLHIPKVLAPKFLTSLRTQAADLMTTAKSAESAGDEAHPLLKHTLFIYSYALPFLKLCQNFHLAAGVPSLAVLGSPKILSIAESLCGQNFVPVLDVFTVKQQYDNSMITWHQDNIMPSPKRYRSIAMGVYLDDSCPGDGAVAFIPGSHGVRHDWPMYEDSQPPEVVELEIKAGDILIHDLLTVHSAGVMVNSPIRRTIYYEFRAMEQITEEENWHQHQIDSRVDLLASSLAEHAKTHPNSEQFQWNMAPKWREGRDDSADLASIYADPLCFTMDVPEYLALQK